MKILFLSRLYYPQVGGVEKHVQLLSHELIKKGYKIVIITEKFDPDLKNKERICGVDVVRISYPKIKILGLLIIWFRLWRMKRYIRDNDIVHCHDVFIWYLPFRFLFLKKPVYTTFHGWEGVYPVPFKNILLKKISDYLSRGTIAVGKYIEKYYKIKVGFITYGATQAVRCLRLNKQKNRIVFVGRLEEDTGVTRLFEFLKKHRNYKVDFCGDGTMRPICSKYGTVHGFVDPIPFYKKTSICFAGGYLVALEALSYKCKLMIGWSNSLKKDYWLLSPFLRRDAYEWAKKQTWKKLANQYLELWGIKK